MSIYLNNTLVVPTRFPDGTTQVWKLDERMFKDCTFVMVKWEFQNESEFLELAQLKALIDNYNLDAYLRITYLPYARQDKFVSNFTTFALKPFANLLNSLKFKEINIVDPHSVESLTLINNSRATYSLDILEKVIWETKSNLICYPDKGAIYKYIEVYNEFQLPVIYGDKIRDQLSGNITNYKLNGSPLNKNVLIVDDICDGGATFKLLAKELLANGANEINLFVTHGIFSKGLNTLKDSGINRIFTQNGEAGEIQNHITYRTL